MKIKLNRILVVPLIILLIQSCACLHLQTSQPRMYDPDKYLQQLQTTQDQLKSDLLNIQSMFAQLDQSIKNAAYDPNEQLRLLQEGIADQRDALYNIQQYLNLPYNERSCQCFNFSTELRNKLSTQLSNVEQSLNNVESKAKECVDCGMAIQIQNQIKIQKGYLSTMQDTLAAKCCKIYKILYVDNLNAPNWLTGGFTPEQYKAWVNSQLQQASGGNETLVRTCQAISPYSAPDMLSCGQCNDPSMLFNLKARHCELCPNGKIFNYETHRCEYDVVCPPGSKFNEDTVMCEQLQPAYNHSYCPPEAPVWNPQVYGCFKCNSSTPFYDTNLGYCTTCPDQYTYNPTTFLCVHKDCQPDQVYNPDTKQCENKKISNEVSNSQCPADRPYWDKDSLSCSRCPINLPFYNTASKKCQTCPSGSTYDRTRNMCAVQCAVGQQLNQVTLQCQNITRPEPTPGTQTSLCPPDRPIWNVDTKSCSQCAADNPFWNDQTAQCQKCAVGQAWNATANACQISQVVCPQGTVYNSNTKSCEKSGGVIAFCPPDKPFYNTQIMACSQCPYDRPFYDALTNQCIVQQSQPQPIQCPTGYSYDAQTQMCKLISAINTTIAQCPPATPMWDATRGACVGCNPGYQWDPNSKTCVVCANPANCGVIIQVQNQTCPWNYQWSTSQSRCTRCELYQKYNNITKVCDNFCRPGEVYDSNLETCHGTVSRCPIGLIFDQAQLRCECPQGLNYKYSPEKDICQVYCQSNEEYNYLDNKCYPRT